jgi:hypothetical protein
LREQQNRHNSLGNACIANGPYRISISQLKNEDKISIRTMQSNVSLHRQQNNDINYHHPLITNPSRKLQLM